MSNSGAAPTGCYKCGRPGHWSRDCPSSAPYSAGSPNPNSSSGLYSSKPSSVNAGGGGSKPAGKSSEKPKKVPRTRPKLTPQLLLSDDGLGYVLRHFPRAFKYRGLGHEVADLGNLISLYFEWHSHVLPYYSFDQFVRKVEQVGTTRHVKMCIRELRERVANGGDPTKLRETPVEHYDPNSEQGLSAPAEAMNSEEPSCVLGDLSSKDHDAVDLEDYMLQEIYKKDTEAQLDRHIEANEN
ncbi:uncharacterized protein LOC131154454 isoform X2 [Malania oleifera]|uniref:uncharacterized protein LOC131154454 isoform X2 n=1 Tax=Malania oleifera TaxID=397392 RepID=UPI0025ADFE5D|nr:uncharacterized protein LOC131154454 isoform X2 [Malania oleifera]